MQKQIEAYELELISASDLKAARGASTRNAQTYRIKLRSWNLDPEMRLRSRKSKSNVADHQWVRPNCSKNAIRSLIEIIEIENGQLIEIVWKA